MPTDDIGLSTNPGEVEPDVWVAPEDIGVDFDDLAGLDLAAHADRMRAIREEFDAPEATKEDLWRATWAFTKSRRVVPIADLTANDPSILVTAEGWPGWVRARLVKPPAPRKRARRGPSPRKGG
jgi:hypothetical protein